MLFHWGDCQYSSHRPFVADLIVGPSRRAIDRVLGALQVFEDKVVSRKNL